MYAQHARRVTGLVLGLLITISIAAPVAAGGEHFRGKLVSYHAEDASMTRTVVAGYALESNGQTYRLNFRDTSLAQYVGHNVDVTGTRSGRTVTVTGYQATATTTTAAATQNKNLAVIMLNFQNDTRTPYTSDYVANVMFNNNDSVANYFAEESYGQMAVTGSVFGWYTIAYDNTGCSYDAWGAAAKTAAQQAGADFTGYTNFVYVFPSAGGCGWSGLAYLPGSNSFLNQAVTLRVASHELSHNFGVHHASTYNCVSNGVRVAVSSKGTDCTLSEYGDPFTVMGSASTRHSNAFHKAQMGWFGASGDRQNVTTAGTYTVGPMESSTSTPKLLRVARTGATNQYFYLDFRQPYGAYFDAYSSTDPAVLGVQVRIGPDYPTKTQSWLLDCTPDTSSWGDAACPVGGGFTDPLSGVSVTVQSVDASGATVFVAFSSDTTPPSPPSNLNANGTGPYTMALSWTAATDDRAVAGYRVSRNGVQVGTTTGTTFNDSGLQPNTTYNYSVVAYDAGNNVSTEATGSGTTGAADTQAPSAPSNLKATVNKSGVTALSWTGSTDNFGVAGYRVYRNGSLFATTSATSYNAKKVRGTFTYYVVAYDQAGNVSGQSNSVQATVR